MFFYEHVFLIPQAIHNEHVEFPAATSLHYYGMVYTIIITLIISLVLMSFKICLSTCVKSKVIVKLVIIEF